MAELLDGGDISCIESDTNWNREKVENHVQYYNARGENTEPQLHLSIDDYFDAGEEFAYVYTLDHEWECFQLTHSYDDNYKRTQTNAVSVDIPLAIVTG